MSDAWRDVVTWRDFARWFVRDATPAMRLRVILFAAVIPVVIGAVIWMWS